jgi:hypothetical protein
VNAEPEPAAAEREACCCCGSPDVGYHNFRDQPFCWPCADGTPPAGPVAFLERARRQVPAVAGVVAGLVVDNPAQFAIIASGSYVVTRTLGNLVRPRTPLQALMTATVAYGVSWWLLGEARRRGVLVFKVRDAHGCLVPLEAGSGADSQA